MSVFYTTWILRIYKELRKNQNSKNQSILSKEIISKSIAVDAASSGNPGVMEYQGVDTISKKKLFQKGPAGYSRFSLLIRTLPFFWALSAARTTMSLIVWSSKSL